ncbi:MAG: hypothetical protein KJ063_19250 [Anaerolineae bacterium]|nr:hypothetical protein [Anaerolineae bacterium]
MQLSINPQQVYLLRMWREREEWQIRVSDLQLGEEYLFTSFEQLFTLLGHTQPMLVDGFTRQENVWGHG